MAYVQWCAPPVDPEVQLLVQVAAGHFGTYPDINRYARVEPICAVGWILLIKLGMHDLNNVPRLPSDALFCGRGAEVGQKGVRCEEDGEE